MEMSSSEVRIEKKDKLLQKYTYIKTTLYIIEKTKLNQTLQPKWTKFLWALGLLAAIPFILLTSAKIWIVIKKDEIEQEPLCTCLNNAVTGSVVSADHIKG